MLGKMTVSNEMMLHKSKGWWLTPTSQSPKKALNPWQCHFAQIPVSLRMATQQLKCTELIRFG
jgi:hypothetical protein